MYKGAHSVSAHMSELSSLDTTEHCFTGGRHAHHSCIIVDELCITQAQSYNLWCS
jgi:hypothetical protein